VKKIIALLMLAFVAAGDARGFAQEPTKSAPPPGAAAQVPLRVQLVLSRFAGEKKLSSVPYTLSVIANDNDKTSLRMGVDVPVPSSVFSSKEGGNLPVTSYSYRSLGTNIDCAARTVEGGVFRLDLAVEETSVFLPEKSASTVAGAPAFRTFRSTFNVLLKDGQTTQHTAATDQVSGEVLRVDVTVNVIK
jgi:hypothetical protein